MKNANNNNGLNNASKTSSFTSLPFGAIIIAVEVSKKGACPTFYKVNHYPKRDRFTMYTPCGEHSSDGLIIDNTLNFSYIAGKSRREMSRRCNTYTIYYKTIEQRLEENRDKTIEITWGDDKYRIIPVSEKGETLLRLHADETSNVNDEYLIWCTVNEPENIQREIILDAPIGLSLANKNLMKNGAPKKPEVKPEPVIEETAQNEPTIAETEQKIANLTKGIELSEQALETLNTELDSLTDGAEIKKNRVSAGDTRRTLISLKAERRKLRRVLESLEQGIAGNKIDVSYKGDGVVEAGLEFELDEAPEYVFEVLGNKYQVTDETVLKRVSSSSDNFSAYQNAAQSSADFGKFIPSEYGATLIEGSGILWVDSKQFVPAGAKIVELEVPAKGACPTNITINHQIETDTFSYYEPKGLKAGEYNNVSRVFFIENLLYLYYIAGKSRRELTRELRAGNYKIFYTLPEPEPTNTRKVRNQYGAPLTHNKIKAELEAREHWSKDDDLSDSTREYLSFCDDLERERLEKEKKEIEGQLNDEDWLSLYDGCIDDLVSSKKARIAEIDKRLGTLEHYKKGLSKPEGESDEIVFALDFANLPTAPGGTFELTNAALTQQQKDILEHLDKMIAETVNPDAKQRLIIQKSTVFAAFSRPIAIYKPNGEHFPSADALSDIKNKIEGYKPLNFESLVKSFREGADAFNSWREIIETPEAQVRKFRDLAQIAQGKEVSLGYINDLILIVEKIIDFLTECNDNGEVDERGGSICRAIDSFKDRLFNCLAGLPEGEKPILDALRKSIREGYQQKEREKLEARLDTVERVIGKADGIVEGLLAGSISFDNLGGFLEGGAIAESVVAKLKRESEEKTQLIGYYEAQVDRWQVYAQEIEKDLNLAQAREQRKQDFINIALQIKNPSDPRNAEPLLDSEASFSIFRVFVELQTDDERRIDEGDNLQEIAARLRKKYSHYAERLIIREYGCAQRCAVLKFETRLLNVGLKETSLARFPLRD